MAYSPKWLVAFAAIPVAFFGLAASAQAAVVTFIGTDVGANSTDPRPIANAAAASFAAALPSSTLINFESAPLGSFSNLTIAPGVSLSGTDFLDNNQTIRNTPLNSPDRLYGYNTSAGGSEFAFFNGGFMTFTFASPIQAFGGFFSGIELSDELITFSDGTQRSITLPNPGIGTGGVSFVGFTDFGQSISSVQVDTRTQTFPLGDFVGVDNVRFSTIAVAPAPEPSSLLLFGSLLAAAGLWQAKRQKVTSH